MKKKIKLQILILFALLGIVTKTISQDNYKLHLKDYHSAQITDIVVTNDEKRIITVDNTGKILKYNTDDFSYHSTLKKSDGFFIEKPRIVFDGKGLLYKSKDSLWVLDSKGKILAKNPFKGQLLKSKTNNLIILTEEKNILDSSISIFSDKFQQITSFKTSYKIIAASIKKDTSHLAYVEEEFPEKHKLVYRNLKSNTVVWENKVTDSHKILHTFFNDDNNSVYTITLSKEKKVISIFSYKKGIRSLKPEIQFPWNGIRLSTIVTDLFSESKKFIITKKNSISYSYPIIIEFLNGKFYKKEIELKKVCNTAIFLNSKKELVVPNLYFPNGYNDIAGFSVQNLNKNLAIKHPKFSREFYKGMFLSDDSFLVEGEKMVEKNNFKSTELQIKYFSKGTFYNRFNTLSFADYLELTHKVYFYSTNYLFDKNEGLIIFRGEDLKTKENHIFKYNFIEDKVTKLYKIKNKYFNVVDYDATSNKLLLSPKRYYNRGYTDPQPFAIVEKNKIKELKGLYKFAKFSKGAKYILTINDKNLAELRTNLKTKVLEEQLTNGSYLLNSLGDGFIISNSFQTIDYGKCNKESVFFIPQKNNTFKIDKKPCLYLNNLSFKNDDVAMSFDGVGVIVGEKRIPESNLEGIKSISFNKSATKLMTSYANGKISIVDTETLKEIGGMFHPSEKEHIFYDANNHYFSNINADDFLYVTKNDKKESLQNADEVIFKPQEVLNVFGTPNKEYLTLLQKAISVRKNKKEISEIKSLEIQNNERNVTNKGDLYVLSIGVSEYKQSAYNLTFADKDAFDIANLYGKLDTVEVNKFKKSFLGNTLSLQSESSNNLGSIKKYFAQFTSLKELIPISSDGTKWLELGNSENENFVWDYTTNQINEIKLPKEFKMDLWGKCIYSSSDNNNFYFKTENKKLFKYNFNSKKYTEIKLSSNLDLSQNSNNIQPLENNKWFYFEELRGLDTKIRISIGKENEQKIDTLIFNIDTYNYYKKPIVKDSISVYNPQFKSISKNGKYLLYREGEDNTFVLKLEKNQQPIKTSIKIKSTQNASISEDGERIVVLENYVDGLNYRITTYNLNGDILDTKKFTNDDNIKGVSILNATPKWIKEYEPLVDNFNYESFSSFDLLSKNNPFSFNKTFVKKITNSEATKENVESEIANFLKNTKEEDQVILFIAGHGVLDKNNNYYYAPYNMDFSDVTKNGVAFNTIIKGLSNIKASQKLLLMDTCHAGNTLDLESENNGKKIIGKEGERGTITKSNKKEPSFKVSEIVGTLFDDFMSKSGITVLSASSGSDVAYENKELSNGAFTSAYLKVLKNKFGYLPKLEDLEKSVIIDSDFIQEVLKEVMLLTNGKQIPDIREINKNIILKAW